MYAYRQSQLAPPSFPTNIGSPVEIMGSPVGNPMGIPMGSPIGAIPPQINQEYLSNILTQYQRPQGPPPTQMVNIYQQLKSDPVLLRRISSSRPKTLQEVTQIIQGDSDYRPDLDRFLPPFCYFRWSLVFTFTDIYLVWPSTNIFGLVVGFCYPFLTPCAIPDFQIIFALC